MPHIYNLLCKTHLSAISHVNFRDHSLGQIQFWDLEYKLTFRYFGNLLFCLVDICFVFLFIIFVLSPYTAKEFFNFSFFFFYVFHEGPEGTASALFLSVVFFFFKVYF